jgi:hypothetical protein
LKLHQIMNTVPIRNSNEKKELLLNFTDLIAVINNIKRLIILINLFYLIIKSKRLRLIPLTLTVCSTKEEEGSATKRATQLSLPVIHALQDQRCTQRMKINYGYQVTQLIFVVVEQLGTS